jgi:hypothetical protein
VKSHDELVAELLEMYPDAKTEVPVRIREGASEGRGYSNVRTSEGFVDVMFWMPGTAHPMCSSLVVCEVKTTFEKCSAGDIVRQLQRYRSGITDAGTCQKPRVCSECGEEPGDVMFELYKGDITSCCAALLAPRAPGCDACEVILALYTDRVLTKAELLILDRASVIVI